MKKLFVGSYLILNLTLWVLATVIHVWTILIAFASSEHAFLAAVLTFITPIFSQIYWGYEIWQVYGITSIYLLTLFGYIGLWILSIWGMTYVSKWEEDNTINY